MSSMATLSLAHLKRGLTGREVASHWSKLSMLEMWTRGLTSSSSLGGRDEVRPSHLGVRMDHQGNPPSTMLGRRPHQRHSQHLVPSDNLPRFETPLWTTPTSTGHRYLSSSAATPWDDNDDDSSASASATSTGTSGAGAGGRMPFLLADIGEGIAEVELMQWFVQEGDHVQQFDRICEVQSDKATVEITSRYDGKIHSLEHAVGDMVKVGQPLLFMAADITHGVEGGGEDGGTSPHGSRETAPAGQTQTMDHDDDQLLHIPTIASRYHFSSDDDPATAATATTTTTTNTMASSGIQNDGNPLAAGTSAPLMASSTHANSTKVLTSPAIRKLGKEHNLDLATIVGTGPRGRISKGDVLTVLKERGLVVGTPKPRDAPAFVDTSTPFGTPAAVSSASASTSPSSASETAAAGAPTSIDQVTLPLQQDTALQLRGYNRLMVSTMTASLQIPHMVYADEINLSKFLKYKKDHQAMIDRGNSNYKKLAFLPFAIKAVSQALRRYPLLNSSLDADSNRVTLWRDHNIGIAMDTPRGLIVPVLKRVQEKSLPELEWDLQRLKEAAVQGTVPPDDLRGATFTLSNIGAIGGGGTYMCPVVTAPQVAIGALGKIQRLPRFVSPDSNEVEEAHICVVSWGGDHRVVDGATMARFHSQWKAYMEDPVLLLMELR